jgi:calcineurin-like phosphoesterase family protein
MIFFSSDHHFSHLNIIKYCQRPFQSAEEMNEEMVRRWNTVVMPQDTIYYLGDFSLAKNAVTLFAPRMNGEKFLIMGNHDACHPCHKKKALPARQVYSDAGFKSLELEWTLEIAGQQVLLSHMPYLSEEESPEYKMRHKEFRPTNRGQWLLHGHIHEKWKTKEKMINVGVDVWDFFPVPITEIEKIIRGTTKNL